MDLYDIGKYLHILVAILWLGGAFAVIMLGQMAINAKDSERLIFIAKLTETLAQRIFMPSSLVIFILGAILVWMQWSFAEAWVVFGIAGVVMTGALGGMVLTPLVKQLAALEAGPEADAITKKLFSSAKGDLIMLFTIVWAMVSKPQWSDTLEIGVMVAIIVLAVVAFVRR